MEEIKRNNSFNKIPVGNAIHNNNLTILAIGLPQVKILKLLLQKFLVETCFLERNQS